MASLHGQPAVSTQVSNSLGEGDASLASISPTSFILTLVGVLFSCLVVPFLISHTILWPRINYIEKEYHKLVPLTWDILRGSSDILNFLKTSNLFHRRAPLLATWFNYKCYFVQGTANIRTTFQNKSLSTFFFQGIFTHRVFLLPKEDLALFRTEEDANSSHQPTKHGAQEVRNDFGARGTQHIENLLAGEGTKRFNPRFDEHLAKNVANLAFLDDGWKEYPDLKTVLDIDINRSFIDTLCGPRLLSVNPTFLEDWRCVHDNITLIFLGVPRFLFPRLIGARDRCLHAIQEWTEWATHNFHPDSIAEDGSDPYWGHEFFRERTAMYINVDKFPFKSIAAHNLGLLWGGTANPTPAAFWAVWEICRDPGLLQLVREEATDCLLPSSSDALKFDMEKLLRKPVLQAVFAETLRLRVHGIIPRKTPQEGVNVRGGVIPKHTLFFINSTTQHMDPNVWCTGAAKDHPPEEFWPGRFLLEEKTSKGNFVYSISGKSGAWVPFGGGSHMCPGRFLARRIITGYMAHFFTRYDCEFLSEKAASGALGMSLKTFGLGTLHPSENVPFRIKVRDIWANKL
ncbi:hypothetical protein V2G26_007826 [Clonostachys chloroleuca]